jgi:hypothetical protein
VDEEGYAYTALVNDRLNLAFYIKFRKRELPRLIEWKMMGEGTYVLGMEPSNCFVMGRAKEKELGTLQYIEPQEEREFNLEIGVLQGNEILQYEEKVNKITKKERPKIVENITEFLKALGRL